MNALKKSIIENADVFDPSLGKCRDIEGLVPVSPILIPEYHSKIKQTHQRRKWPLNQATDFIEGLKPMLKDDILELTKDAPIHSISAYFIDKPPKTSKVSGRKLISKRFILDCRSVNKVIQPVKTSLPSHITIRSALSKAKLASSFDSWFN